MSDEDENLVLSSLNELMTLEDDRIKSEADDRRRDAESAMKRKLETEQRARDDEAARIRAEEERRRADQQRAAEEAARFDALKAGEVEKARAEAEQRARIEEIARQQDHERQLAALHQDEGKKKMRNGLIGGVFFIVLACIGLFVFLNQKEQERVRADAVRSDEKRKAEESQRRKDEDAAKKYREVEEQLKAADAKAEKAEKELEDQLKSAGTPEERARVVAELAKVRAQRSGAATNAGKPKAVKDCRPGDPICAGQM